MAKVPDDRLDRAGGDVASRRSVVPASVQFVDIGGLVEGREHRARASATGSSAPSARSTRSSSCCGRSTTTTCPGPPTRSSTCDTLEIELALADLEAVENAGRASDARRPSSDKSLADEVAALEAAAGVLGRGHAALPRRPRPPTSATLLRPYFLLTNKPVLARRERRRGPARRDRRARRPGAAELGDRAEVIGMCVQLEAEAAQLDADERAEMLEALGLGEGALPRVPPRRVPPARAAHLPHHRREGVPGLDVPRRRQGARGRRA